MAFNSTSGSTVGISATAPTTYNSAGYDALTFTTIGELTEIGDIGGEWSKIEHKPINGSAVKLKGFYDPGETTFQMALDTDDAGQILAKAAMRSKNNYYFKITASTGDIYYFAAKVMSFKVKFGGAESVTAADMKVDISGTGAGIDVVEKLTA